MTKSYLKILLCILVTYAISEEIADEKNEVQRESNVTSYDDLNMTISDELNMTFYDDSDMIFYDESKMIISNESIITSYGENLKLQGYEIVDFHDQNATVCEFS